MGSLLCSAGFCWAAPACGSRAVAFEFVTHDRRELVAGVEDMSGACSEVVGVDLASGRVLWRDPGMMTSAHAAMSRDGSRLAISYAGRSAEGGPSFVVLDAHTGKRVTVLQEDRANGLVLTGGDAASVVLSPDGKEVYAALRNGWLAAWDADSGKPLFTQDPPEGSGAGNGGSLAISPDGRLLAWSRGAGVYLLALPPEHAGGQNTVATVRGHALGRDLHAPQFSPDGRSLAIVKGAVPGDTLLWSVAPWHALPPVQGCGGEIAWSPDSRSLACQTLEAVQLVTTGAPRRVLDKRPRVALETPLTPLSSDGGVLLFQEPSPQPNGPAPLVFSAFGTGTATTITLPGGQ